MEASAGGTVGSARSGDGGRGSFSDAQAPASERQRRVSLLSASLRSRLGPFEPALSSLQAALVWEKPARSAIGWVGAHAVFGCAASAAGVVGKWGGGIANGGLFEGASYIVPHTIEVTANTG